MFEHRRRSTGSAKLAKHVMSFAFLYSVAVAHGLPVEMRAIPV
jgi:hypothetical protein